MVSLTGFGIKSGIKVAFPETAQGIVIKPMDTAYFENFAGLYKDYLPSAEEYEKLKKEEKHLEDDKTDRVFKTRNKQ